jgi:hypothetical protein
VTAIIHQPTAPVSPRRRASSIDDSTWRTAGNDRGLGLSRLSRVLRSRGRGEGGRERTKPRSCLSLRSWQSRNSGKCDNREDVNGEAREDEHHFTDNLRLDSMIGIE